MVAPSPMITLGFERNLERCSRSPTAIVTPTISRTCHSGSSSATATLPGTTSARSSYSLPSSWRASSRAPGGGSCPRLVRRPCFARLCTGPLWTGFSPCSRHGERGCALCVVDAGPMGMHCAIRFRERDAPESAPRALPARRLGTKGVQCVTNAGDLDDHGRADNGAGGLGSRSSGARKRVADGSPRRGVPW